MSHSILSLEELQTYQQNLSPKLNKEANQTYITSQYSFPSLPLTFSATAAPFITLHFLLHPHILSPTSMTKSFELKVEGLLGLKFSCSFYENLSSSPPLQYPSINLMI